MKTQWGCIQEGKRKSQRSIDNSLIFFTKEKRFSMAAEEKSGQENFCVYNGTNNSLCTDGDYLVKKKNFYTPERWWHG